MGMESQKSDGAHGNTTRTDANVPMGIKRNITGLQQKWKKLYRIPMGM